LHCATATLAATAAAAKSSCCHTHSFFARVYNLLKRHIRDTRDAYLQAGGVRNGDAG
jgi:hypothetical protein